MTEGHRSLIERIEADQIPFWRHLGIQVTEAVEPGHLIMSLEMRPEFGNRRQNVMHGGVIASLVDSAAGGALRSLFGDDPDFAGQATLDINVSYLNPVTSDVTAEVRVLRHSRSLAFTQTEVFQDGILCAVGRATYSIIRKQPAK